MHCPPIGLDHLKRPSSSTALGHKLVLLGLRLMPVFTVGLVYNTNSI